MASRHAGRQWLEAMKFTLYITTPIAATVFLGSGAYSYLEQIIIERSYIKYPAEGTPPPKSAAGVAEKMQQLRERQRQRTHPTDSKEQQK